MRIDLRGGGDAPGCLWPGHGSLHSSHAGTSRVDEGPVNSARGAPSAKSADNPAANLPDAGGHNVLGTSRPNRPEKDGNARKGPGARRRAAQAKTDCGGRRRNPWEQLQMTDPAGRRGPLYRRLVLSHQDLQEAAESHARLLELSEFDRHPLLEQSADTAAHFMRMVVAYVRPWSGNRQGERPVRAEKSLSADLRSEFSAAESAMHERLKDLRNKEFAHSDAEAADVTIASVPPDTAAAVWRRTRLPFTREEMTTIGECIRKLRTAVVDEKKGSSQPSTRQPRGDTLAATGEGPLRLCPNCVPRGGETRRKRVLSPPPKEDRPDPMRTSPDRASA